MNTLLTDAVALALSNNQDVYLAMRKGMPITNRLSFQCSLSTVNSTSEYLFRDLTKLAKDVREVNKLTKKFAPTS